MKQDRAASLTLADQICMNLMPKRVKSGTKRHFAPIAEYEGAIFAKLRVKESLEAPERLVLDL